MTHGQEKSNRFERFSFQNIEIGSLVRVGEKAIRHCLILF